MEYFKHNGEDWLSVELLRVHDSKPSEIIMAKLKASTITGIAETDPGGKGRIITQEITYYTNESYADLCIDFFKSDKSQK